MSLAWILAYLAVAFAVAVWLTRKGLHPDDATCWVFVPVLAVGCVVLVVGMLFRDAVGLGLGRAHLLEMTVKDLLAELNQETDR